MQSLSPMLGKRSSDVYMYMYIVTIQWFPSCYKMKLIPQLFHLLASLYPSVYLHVYIHMYIYKCVGVLGF